MLSAVCFLVYTPVAGLGDLLLVYGMLRVAAKR